MNYSCPEKNCNANTKNKLVIKDGTYKRSSDSRFIQRYKCKVCLKRFSRSTGTLEYRQKKRRVNYHLYKLLCSGNSLRRSSMLLGINYKTALKKVEYLGTKARLKNKMFLIHLKNSPVKNMQFDDLITIEHTKMKPLSVSLAVDKDRRFILGAEVSRIPASGHLAKKSRKKYGKRENNHIKGLHKLFVKIKDAIDEKCLIESDEHKIYPILVNQFFKNSEYKRYQGGRSCIAGQGELKRKLFDPLFTLNHSCAMLRDSINRLIRKTWCTTKKVKNLQNHIDIFISFYNLIYLKRKLTPR